MLCIIFCALFLILIGRLFYLQIVKGDYYLNNYKLRIRKTREIAGTRGNIYDRNGNLLAYNELAYAVIIEDTIPSDSNRNDTLNGILDNVINIVESHGDSVISSFGIVLDSAGNFQFSQTNETQRLRFIADVYGEVYIDDLTDKQKNQSADEIIHYLCTNKAYGYDLDESLDKEYLLKMINLRYAINLNSYQKYIPTVLASDVSDETAAAIMENLDKLQGVDIEEQSLRRYTDSQYFASIIGYTGQISTDEYDSLDKEEKKKYSLSDIVGKSGLEQVMDNVLQGEKGETVFYVDSVGKVTEVVSYTDPTAGNDVYLTIDKNLQETTYKLLEEKITGIILSKLQNVLDYDPSTAATASDIIIPVGDAYNAFIGNRIIDAGEFGTADAGAAEKEVYQIFTERKQALLSEIITEMNGNTPYSSLRAEMQAYMDYISITVLMENTKILMSDAIDTSDATYLAWTNDESISLHEYLNYAIAQNWVDTSLLADYIFSDKYSDASEIYQAIVSYLEEYLSSNDAFDKLIYKYMIKAGYISGSQICAIAYEQGVLPMEEAVYNGLRDGSTDSYTWLYEKIQTLEITPGQLGLEPCTGSAVVSDPNTGEILACVSYPGYDNNRLANTMDSEYYNQLVTGLSRPFYNNATQERTAPGSTFKMVSSVAALEEGLVDGSTYLPCTGIYTKITPSPKCWVYPGAHGSVNVVDALCVSCNNFFYEVGYQLGLDEKGEYDSDKGVKKLAEYAEMFGFSENTGIEIPESEPQISDVYAVPSAIGQGTNNYTVSQLNRYVATVANKGTLYKLTLLDKTTDSNGKIIKQYEPEATSKLDKISDSTWNFIHQGMAAMIDDTTSFADLEIDMAGKTGTAQQSALHADHALFVGFAPLEDPEIAIAVRIANGYYSSYTAEIGRDIVKAHYGLADINDLVSGNAADLGTDTVGD